MGVEAVLTALASAVTGVHNPANYKRGWAMRRWSKFSMFVVAAATATTPAFAAQVPPPGNASILLEDQAIGCYRGYSFSTAAGSDAVAAYYDRHAKDAGLKPANVQRRHGFYFATYNDTQSDTTSRFAFSVAINSQSKPTTATVMYRPKGTAAPSC